MALPEFNHHLEVLNNASNILSAAQNVKEDPEYKQAMNYMRTQKMRGRIKEIPCKKNGYTVEV